MGWGHLLTPPYCWLHPMHSWPQPELGGLEPLPKNESAGMAQCGSQAGPRLDGTGTTFLTVPSSTQTAASGQVCKMLGTSGSLCPSSGTRWGCMPVRCRVAQALVEMGLRGRRGGRPGAGSSRPRAGGSIRQDWGRGLGQGSRPASPFCVPVAGEQVHPAHGSGWISKRQRVVSPCGSCACHGFIQCHAAAPHRVWS